MQHMHPRRHLHGPRADRQRGLRANGSRPYPLGVGVGARPRRRLLGQPQECLPDHSPRRIGTCSRIGEPGRTLGRTVRRMGASIRTTVPSTALVRPGRRQGSARVMLYVADRDFEPLPEPTPDILNAPMNPTDPTFDTLIEVIHLESGRVLAERRPPTACGTSSCASPWTAGRTKRVH